QQTKRRDLNGRYLAGRLSKLPGLYPQKRRGDHTRNSYHLFMMRVDGSEFGVDRETLVKALKEEGILSSAGYGYPLNQQPLFRNKTFGPYLANAKDRLDFTNAPVPNSDLLCRDQALWLEQSIFLGRRADMDDIASAFEKIYEQRDSLRRIK